MKFFETFKCLGQNLSNSWHVNFEMTTQFLLKFYIPLKVHERSLLCTFLAQTIYTLLKRSPLKRKSLRLSSARVKICLIPYICQFWNGKLIPLKMVYPSSIWGNITPLYFFSSSNICFAQKEPINLKIFETFNWLGQNSSNSWYVNFEMTSQFLLRFYIPLHFHKELLLCIFLAQTIYSLLKRSPLKRKLLRLSSGYVKIRQIPDMSTLKWQVNSS